jgi:hypothetical protein
MNRECCIENRDWGTRNMGLEDHVYQAVIIEAFGEFLTAKSDENQGAE